MFEGQRFAILAMFFIHKRGPPQSLIHIRGPPPPYPQNVDNLPFFCLLNPSLKGYCQYQYDIILGRSSNIVMPWLKVPVCEAPLTDWPSTIHHSSRSWGRGQNLSKTSNSSTSPAYWCWLGDLEHIKKWTVAQRMWPRGVWFFILKTILYQNGLKLHSYWLVAMLIVDLSQRLSLSTKIKFSLKKNTVVFSILYIL